MSTFLTILVAGFGTYMSRALFILVLGNWRFPPMALRALEYVAPAVMGALVVSMLTTSDGRVQIGTAEFAGLLCAAWVAFSSRNHVYTLIAAMSVYLGVAALPL